MAKKSFDIAGKKKTQGIEPTQQIESFIAGSESQTTVTVQIPERLKFSLKKEALDKRTTVKNLLIRILEAHFIENK